MMTEDLSTMDDAKLERRADQAWEMAGLARQDRDTADEQRWTAKAQLYDAEISRRRDR